jgi:predicted RNA-binding protein with RPS1 domain
LDDGQRNLGQFFSAPGRYDGRAMARLLAFVLCSATAAAPPARIDPKKLVPGAVIEGVVKNVTEYGCFIDVGGIDGLAHITDLSWARLASAGEVCTVGKKLKVVVIKYNPETERLSLSHKALTPDPWTTAAKRYPVGKKVMGKFAYAAEYGAFVELEPGIEGLVHQSEFTDEFTKHFEIGSPVEVVILDLDAGNFRASLAPVRGKKVKAQPPSREVLADRMKELIPNLRASLNVLEPMAKAGAVANDELASARQMATLLQEDANAYAAAGAAGQLATTLTSSAQSLRDRLTGLDPAKVAAARGDLEALASALDQLEKLAP